jgi:hypothetical protein
MLTLEKDYIAEDDLTVYTIKLDDGQQLSINEYEMKELLKQLI